MMRYAICVRPYEEGGDERDSSADANWYAAAAQEVVVKTRELWALAAAGAVGRCKLNR